MTGTYRPEQPIDLFPDFTKDEIGDTGGVGESTLRGGTIDANQNIGKDSMGEATYTDTSPNLGQKLVATLARALTPQPIPTPETPFIIDTDTAEQLADLIRYVTEQSKKTVQVGSRHFKTWRHTISAGPPVRIAGYQPNRQRLLIAAYDAPVLIGNDESVSLATGFIVRDTTGGTIAMPPLEMFTRGEVFATPISTSVAATVTLLAEYYE